jgi:hypothetical protein
VNPQERSDARPFNPHVARAEADRMFHAPVPAASVARPLTPVLPVAHRRGDGSGVGRAVQAVCGVMGLSAASVLAVSLLAIAGGA